MSLIQKSWEGVAVSLPADRPRGRNWGRAFNALNKLLEDGEDTRQAFEITRALGGRSIENAFRKFLREPTGPMLLERREELADVLDDHDALRKLPAGSFGRAYLDFVSSEGLSAAGLVEENKKIDSYNEGDPADDLAWFGRRLRDTHDLWHVLTGYGRDGLGELALLAFSYSQAKNLGTLFIAYMGARADRKYFGLSEAMDVIWQAKKDGREAAFLPAVDYRAEFARPLQEVRERLKIKTPQTYRETLPVYMGKLEQFGLAIPKAA